MGKRDPRVDAYIAKAAPFAQPILMHLREVVHAASPIVVPKDLAAAVKANKKAQATFAGFPPSAQREYVEWITEAKTDATRSRRLTTAVEWIAEGKRRMWKYGA